MTKSIAIFLGILNTKRIAILFAIGLLFAVCKWKTEVNNQYYCRSKFIAVLQC